MKSIEVAVLNPEVTHFCGVDSNGSANCSNAANSYGVAFGFCV